MQRRQLGQSGFEITTIGVGSWAIGGMQWGGHQDDRDSIAAIHAAVDHGVNWVDTAPIYGSGHSETCGRQGHQGTACLPAAIGVYQVRGRRRAIGDRPLGESRQRAGRVRQKPAPTRSRSHRPLPDALARTRSDCRDGWCVRDPLDRRQDSSGRRLELLRCPASGVASHRRAAALGAASVQHSSAAAAHDVLPWCAANNVGAIGYSPLFRGLLFGTWSIRQGLWRGRCAGCAQGLRRRAIPAALAGGWGDSRLANANALSVPQLCIGTLLGTPGLTGSIVGARNSHQGALIASLGVTVTGEHARMVWESSAGFRPISRR